MGKNCYSCGKPATSREHVPPRMLFRGFECDSITVPACDLHNSEKSNNDQAVIATLALPLINILNDGNSDYSLHPDIQRFLTKVSSTFSRTKNRVKSVPVKDDDTDINLNLPEIAHFKGRINQWMIQLTAGLVYDLVGYTNLIKWEQAIVRSPDWIDNPKPLPVSYGRLIKLALEAERVKDLEQSFNWIDGWSATPRPYPNNIYNFQLVVGLDSRNEILFRHNFLNNYRWYIFFEAPGEIISKIDKNLKTQL